MLPNGSKQDQKFVSFVDANWHDFVEVFECQKPSYIESATWIWFKKASKKSVYLSGKDINIC